MFKKVHIFAHKLGGDYFLPILAAMISRRIPEKEARQKTVPPATLA
jgi:hypothetical protein